MEWALIALAQAGFQMFQQKEQQLAAEEAQRAGRRLEVKNQNKLLEERLSKMRGVGTGSVLGGSPLGKARQASQQGSILSNSNTQTLLGNTL